MASTFTGIQRSGTTQTVDLVTDNPPVAGAPLTFTLAADGSRFGFEAVQNQAGTLRFQTPATSANADWLPLFQVARAIGTFQNQPNTAVTVEVSDGTSSGLFAGDGFLVEARGDSTATLTLDAAQRLPYWAGTINDDIEASGPDYILEELTVLGADIALPEIVFTVTPYTADTIATPVAAVTDPEVAESLDVLVRLSRQAFDLMGGDDRSATGMVAAEIENTDAADFDVDLGLLLSQDSTYIAGLPVTTVASVTGQFSVDNVTSFSGTVYTGAVGLSLNGNDLTPVFVSQPDMITAFSNDDTIRLQFREQGVLLRLAPGARVVVVASSRS